MKIKNTSDYLSGSKLFSSFFDLILLGMPLSSFLINILQLLYQEYLYSFFKQHCLHSYNKLFDSGLRFSVTYISPRFCLLILTILSRNFLSF